MSGTPVVVISEPGRSPLHLLLVGPLEVGRDATGVILNDPAVSRRHLEIRPTEEGVVVTDLGSANGTMVDGTTFTGSTDLTPGRIVQLGDTTIRLEADADASEPGIDASVDDGLTTISRLVAGISDTPVTPPRSALADGTVTIVFTDIESSTALAQSYGDQRWFSILRRHAEMVKTLVEKHGGTEVKNQGDGFMLAFGAAHRAIDCMIEVQRDVTALAESEPEMAVTIRAGAHTGEVIVDDDGDLFGHHVNVAARIADQADGGEIIVSSLVREIVESRGDLLFGESRSVTLKGLAGTYLIHPVLWRE